MSRRVLTVAAHPDDEVLGCGATIAKHSYMGDKVWILILGEGITSRKALSLPQKKKSLVELQKSAEKASRILGAEKLITKNLPDNQFDSVPLLEIIQTIEKVTNEFKPSIIYTHHQSDINIDHRRTLEAVGAVIRPTKNSNIDETLTFEVASSTDWNFTRNPFKPNVFNQIDEENFDKKIAALKAYSTEMRPFPHPRSQEYLRALAKVRGGQAGVQMAEAFELIFARKWSRK